MAVAEAGLLFDTSQLVELAGPEIARLAQHLQPSQPFV